MDDAKTTLTPFDGKPTSDFMIWYMRIIATLKCKGLLHCVEKTYSVSGSPPTRPSSELESEKASILIIEALGDRPLRIVSNLTEDPRDMLNNLRERYAPTSALTKSTVLAELHSPRYKSGNMSDYIDRFTGLLDRLESMDAPIPSELARTLFLSSMDGKFDATVYARMVIESENLTWKT
jgi:gag-polypeptide of LTR copia-type